MGSVFVGTVRSTLTRQLYHGSVMVRLDWMHIKRSAWSLDPRSGGLSSIIYPRADRLGWVGWPWYGMGLGLAQVPASSGDVNRVEAKVLVFFFGTFVSYLLLFISLF